MIRWSAERFILQKTVNFIPFTINNNNNNNKTPSIQFTVICFDCQTWQFKNSKRWRIGAAEHNPTHPPPNSLLSSLHSEKSAIGVGSNRASLQPSDPYCNRKMDNVNHFKFNFKFNGLTIIKDGKETSINTRASSAAIKGL